MPQSNKEDVNFFYISALKVKFLYLLQKSAGHEKSNINNLSLVHGTPSHYLCMKQITIFKFMKLTSQWGGKIRIKKIFLFYQLCK